VFISWQERQSKRTYDNVTKRYCTHCKMERFFSVVHVRDGVEFFRALSFDYKKTFQLICTVCKKGHGLTRQGAQRLVDEAGLEFKD